MVDQPNHKTLFSRPDRVHKPLYVITTIFNAVRWRSRWKLFEDFRAMVARVPDAKLYFAEAAFHERDFVFAEEGNPQHLRLIVNDELWIKENMMNLTMQILPKDWEYLLFADADIQFVRSDWADEIRQQHQHYPVLQPWSEAHGLGPNHEIVKSFKSFIYSWKNSGEVPPAGYYGDGSNNMQDWHPGFAWSFRRDAMDLLGGMVDWSILGSADKLMAYALIGEQWPQRPDMGPNGNLWMEKWAQRAALLNKDIGYVDGALLHQWHGPKSARGYGWRNTILTENKFDPVDDMFRDWQGLWALMSRKHMGKPKLRDDLRAYFRQRNEDSTDI